MKRNPYATRPANEEVFVGRESLKRQLTEGLQSGRCFSLVGSAGMGKTSLLLAVQKALITLHNTEVQGFLPLPIYVECQRHQKNVEEILSLIVKGLIEAIPLCCHIQCPMNIRNQAQSQAEQGRLENAFNIILEWLFSQKKRSYLPVLLVDDLHRISGTQCLQKLTAILQTPANYQKLALVLACQHELIEELRDDVSPLRMLISQHYRLEPFTLEETRLLVEKASDYPIEDGFIELLFKITGGHPYRLHYYLYGVLSYAGTFSIEGLQRLDSPATKKNLDDLLQENQEERPVDLPVVKKVPPIHILHLSDIHLGTESEAQKYRAQLETDLMKELQVNKLEYLVISGDIANYSTEEEYQAAFVMVDGLIKRFGLHVDTERVIIVPGNHDLNWGDSKKAYSFVYQDDLPEPLPEGRYILARDAGGALLRNDELYRQRFANFNTHFWKKVYTGQEYSLDPAKQAIVTERPDDCILFLALNSCWQIDHHFRQRAEINMDTLSNALGKLQDEKYDKWLKIAVWHHPVTGKEMMNDEFLQLLAVHDFQICMHGHIHEAQEGFYKYDSKRGLHIIGAGTFGAPTNEQVPGIPLQYNLLTLDPEAKTITVNTRKKEKPDGAWSADARWGDKNDPKPRYTIKLKNYKD